MAARLGPEVVAPFWCAFSAVLLVSVERVLISAGLRDGGGEMSRARLLGVVIVYLSDIWQFAIESSFFALENIEFYLCICM